MSKMISVSEECCGEDEKEVAGRREPIHGVARRDLTAEVTESVGLHHRKDILQAQGEATQGEALRWERNSKRARSHSTWRSRQGSGV